MAGAVRPPRPTCSDSQYTALFLCTVFSCLTTGQQLNTFNHQAKIFVGGKFDSSGKLVRTFRGSLAGLVPLCILCVNRRAITRDTTFTEFTEAVSDNTNGISKHRLSPYIAHCLNYSYSSTLWIWDIKLFKVVCNLLWKIISLVSYPVFKHKLSNSKSTSSFVDGYQWQSALLVIMWWALLRRFSRSEVKGQRSRVKGQGSKVITRPNALLLRRHTFWQRGVEADLF